MTEQRNKQGPLAGVMVLDLSRVLAGPWATQLLADMGAEVIKVERPGTGDDTRNWGPPFYTTHDGRSSDAAYFMAANRGKKSITINLKTHTGQELVQKLATKADILVENFKVGALKELNLDYETLAAINPKLIYCSITGFGQTGPMKDFPGYDYMIQAMSGMMSITGRADDEPGAGPVRTGVAVADLFTGFYASNAILAALLHARTTGQGQQIDLALLDCQMACLINQATNWMQSGKRPERTGNDHPNLVPYGVYEASDMPFVLAIGNDRQFVRFCEFAGHDEWAGDSRFSSNTDRLANRSMLDLCLGPVLASRPADCWIEGLAAVGVPAGPIQNIADAFAMPQTEARNMIDKLTRPDLSQSIKTPASPIRYSMTHLSQTSAPPALGADAHEVLGQYLGLSELEIARLAKKGII